MKHWQHALLMVLALAFVALVARHCENQLGRTQRPAPAPERPAPEPSKALAVVKRNLALTKKVAVRVERLEDELFQCNGALSACIEGELILLDRVKACE